MEGLKLYKLLATEDNEYETALADEIRWESDGSLLVWISYLWIKEFMDELVKLFGTGIFDYGAFNGNFQDGCVCIDLEEAIGFDADLEGIFPKEKYSL